MRVVVINKEAFHQRPPVISTVLLLNDLGYDVTLISVAINDYWNKELDVRNINRYIIPDKSSRNRFNKVVEYLNFKKRVSAYLAQHIENKHDTLLWIIGGNTIFCLGDRIKKYRYILQIQELHENDRKYRRVFERVINDAEQVFVNEYNRSVLYQCWYNMRKRPLVIPNKPYFIDTETPYDLTSYIEESLLDELTDKKIILFQGQIVQYRDLSPYILAAKMLGGYQVVLLGNDYDMVSKYKVIDNTLIHIKRIPAPQYLAVTALAHICLITYDPHSLNNVYCAPNKIYEYGAFGKPMVGNDIPGLKLIEDYHAGILVDEDNIEAIKSAFQKIENNYQAYSEGARILYESVDNSAIISHAIKHY